MNLLGEFDALLPYSKLLVRLHCFMLFTESLALTRLRVYFVYFALCDYDL